MSAFGLCTCLSLTLWRFAALISLIDLKMIVNKKGTVLFQRWSYTYVNVSSFSLHMKEQLHDQGDK